VKRLFTGELRQGALAGLMVERPAPADINTWLARVLAAARAMQRFVQKLDPVWTPSRSGRIVTPAGNPSKSGSPGESGRLDLNQRPSGPQPDALPDCATPRRVSEFTPEELERATGLEPVMGAWKAPVLPTTPRPRGIVSIVGRCGGRLRAAGRQRPGRAAQPRRRPKSIV
jgi:hypothetical protein